MGARPPGLLLEPARSARAAGSGHAVELPRRDELRRRAPRAPAHGSLYVGHRTRRPRGADARHLRLITPKVSVDIRFIFAYDRIFDSVLAVIRNGTDVV